MQNLQQQKNMQQKSECKTCNNKNMQQKHQNENLSVPKTLSRKQCRKTNNSCKQTARSHFFQGPALCVASLQARTVQKVDGSDIAASILEQSCNRAVRSFVQGA